MSMPYSRWTLEERLVWLVIVLTIPLIVLLGVWSHEARDRDCTRRCSPDLGVLIRTGGEHSVTNCWCSGPNGEARLPRRK